MKQYLADLEELMCFKCLVFSKGHIYSIYWRILRHGNVNDEIWQVFNRCQHFDHFQMHNSFYLHSSNKCIFNYKVGINQSTHFMQCKKMGMYRMEYLDIGYLASNFRICPHLYIIT